MDIGTVGADLANNPLAQLATAVLALAGGWRMWRQQSGVDAKDRADSYGQIAALQTWKELLEGERASRVRAEERSDKFAMERNEAMQAAWEMRGQIKSLNEHVEKQDEELVSLRDKVCELEEKINGNNP